MEEAGNDYSAGRVEASGKQGGVFSFGPSIHHQQDSVKQSEAERFKVSHYLFGGDNNSWHLSVQNNYEVQFVTKGQTKVLNDSD